MGLGNYKEWKFRKMLVAALSDEFGISEADLAYLPEALKLVKEMSEAKPVVYDEPKKSDEEKAAEALKMTPEQMVAMFAGDVEDFK